MTNVLKPERASGWIWPVCLAAIWLSDVFYADFVWYPTHVRICQLLQEGTTVGEHLLYVFLVQTIGVGCGIVLALVILLMTVRTCFRVRIAQTSFSASFKKWLSVLIVIFCFFVAIATGIIVFRSLQIGVNFLGKDIRLLDYLDPIAISSILCCSAFSFGQKDAGWKNYGVSAFCMTIMVLMSCFGSDIIIYLYGEAFFFLVTCVYLALWIAKGAKKDKKVLDLESAEEAPQYLIEKKSEKDKK